MSKGTTGIARHDLNINDVAATSVVSRLLAEDTTPWYQKKNLRTLYAFLVPAALGVEITTDMRLFSNWQIFPKLILSF